MTDAAATGPTISGIKAAGTENSGRHIVVIGAGIGGLTAACAFAQSGAQVTVLEQAPALTEVGAGVQITPNGFCVLHALGLGPALEAIAIRAATLAPSDAMTGRRLARMDVSARPYHFLYRPDLIGILSKGCADHGVTIRINERVPTGPNGPELPADVAPADLIIGADGLHSQTRAVLNGSDAPFFTHQVAWRAIIPQSPSENTPPEARVWMAPGRHVVTYPLRGNRLNIVAVREQAEWAPEGWNTEDAPEAMQSAFSQCGGDLQDILAQVTNTRLWGLFRHPVADHWHKSSGGRSLAMLGDAAHPTLPFLAQGANLAIEDAWVLAASCAGALDLEAGLARYQAKRRPRVTRAIKAANANAVNFHLSGATRFAAHTGLWAIGKVAPHFLLNRLDWLYQHDVTA